MRNYFRTLVCLFAAGGLAFYSLNASEAGGGTIPTVVTAQKASSTTTTGCANYKVCWVCNDCLLESCPILEGYPDVGVGTYSSYASIIDNLAFTHIHMGNDYAKCSTPSCGSCGGGSPSENLPCVQLSRALCARNAIHDSSIGPAQAFDFDAKLAFYPSGGGYIMTVFDPKAFGINYYRDLDGDGKYDSGIWNATKETILYDGHGYDEANRINAPIAGGVAVVHLYNGKKFYFDIIDLSGGSSGTLTEGLHVHLPFDDAVGSTVADVSGQGRNGTLNGGPAWSAGKINGGITLDGIDDSMTMANYAGVSNSAPRTISAWIKTGSTASQAIVSYGKDETYKKFIFGVEGNSPAGALRCEVNGGNIIGHMNVADGQWHHVAVSLESSNGAEIQINEAKMYVDGMIQMTSGATGAPVRTADGASGGIDVLIGNDHHNRHFKGSIDDVRIYDRALSSGEIRAMLEDATSRAYAGRLTRMEQRNKYGIDIAYKHFTAQEIAESPSRQWQIDTVRDPQGRQLAFTYRAEQVAGRWSVESILLPDGVNSVHYVYNQPDATATFLSKIIYPDQTESTFDRVYDSASKCTRFAISDLGADPTHRFKNSYVSANTILDEDDGHFFQQSSGAIRFVTNGANQVVYMNIPDPVYTQAFIYEGGGKMKYVNCAWEARYATSWSFKDLNDISFGKINFASESTFEYCEYSSANNWQSWYQGTPSFRRDITGRQISYVYNSAKKVTKATYGDGTTEEYTYNSFQQVTRHKDRLGRVNRSSFDNRGNITLKEVGIKFVGGADVNQSEYAAYRFDYYPEGHPNAGLLQYAYDAVGDPIAETGNRTDYIYDASNLLVAVIEPADIDGGTRAQKTYTYDGAGRLETSTDAENRLTRHFYDGNGRMVKALYSDSSTERYIYGDNASAYPGFLVKQKDRNGYVTEMAYDAAGRTTLRKTGHEIMDTNDVVTESTTEPEVAAYTYVNGTTLVADQIVNGEKTRFDYDYRHRLKKTTVYPRVGVTLASTTTYKDNLVFKQTDPYGRSTFNNYRGSDAALLRTIQGTVPEFTLADYAAIGAKTRDLNANAQYLITDYDLDAEAQTIGVIDPRGANCGIISL